LDSGFGYVGVLEFIFIFTIVILVVGPRRIVHGWRVIKEWVRNGFRRAGKTNTAQNGRKFMRGFGSMVSYFTRDKENDT
jgi:Sec-independent protein translocase protein TatA